MANNLSLSNVINVTLVPTAKGLSEFNTANLLLYSTEPTDKFGEDKYRFYYNASNVAEDFGSDSLTYKMALGVFSQTPNILSNSGALIIAIKEGNESQVEAFNRLKTQVLFCGWITTDSILTDIHSSLSYTNPSSIEATENADTVENIKSISSPSITLTINNIDNTSSEVSVDFDFSEASDYNDVASVIQNSIREEIGNNNWTCKFDEIDGDVVFVIACFDTEIKSFSVDDNDLTTALKINSESNPNVAESEEHTGLSNAINAENNKINFIVANDEEIVDVEFLDIKEAGLKKTRCLFYGGTETEAKVMMASYASKAMSTIFEASLTTQTMHLKPLTGVLPDPIMTETLLSKCKLAGVDSYISIEGVACVFSTGENGFFDEVFNELWFVNAIQVAGFNYLRQTNTKIPQTEVGMDGLKNAYKQVCVRGVNNGFIAAGSWTLPDTFGNPDTFKRNIENSGFYVYSTPVAQQTQADREARKAPLVQIAIKTAGAIHSTNVMIYVNL